MRNKNTLCGREYIGDSLYWTSLAFLVYKGTLFYPVIPEREVLSVLLLMATIFFGMCCGVLLTWRRQRNYCSMACNLVFCVAVYFFLSFWSVNRRLVVITGAAALVLAACYFLLVMANYNADRRRKGLKVPVGRCLGACLLNCRMVVAAVLASAIVLTWGGLLLGFPVLEAKKSSARIMGPADREAAIAENMDTILRLQAEEWDKLDATARLDVLKTVADIEAGCLGISEVRVCSQILENYVLGQYNDRTDTVSLSLSYLVSEDANTMLETLCHEVYHAYQHRIVAIYNELSPENKDLLLFSDAARYQLEFDNYIDGTEDYWGYSLQRCETDSDAYAARAAAEYYRYIEEYEP